MFSSGGGDVDQATQLSLVSAALFCLLSIQTGLSGMPVLQRITRLNRNGWLQCVAFLHFIQDLVKPVLLQMSSQVGVVFCSFVILIIIRKCDLIS